MPLQLEADHLTEVAARSGQLEHLHHHGSPIEADVNVPRSELLGPKLGIERAGRILDALDDEVGQAIAAPESHDGDPTVFEREPDGLSQHQSDSGRHKRNVTPASPARPLR
jgi:hypothetical protein